MNEVILAIIVNLAKDRKVSQSVGRCISMEINNAEYVKYALKNGYLRISTPMENIDTATLKNIKLALKESGLKQAGEKNEIRKRLKEQGDIEVIDRIFTNDTYKLTEKGKQLLKNKEYAVLYDEYEIEFFYPYISLKSLQKKIEKENKDFITACKELYTEAKNKNDGSEMYVKAQELKFYEFFKQDIREIKEILKEEDNEPNFLDTLNEKDRKILEKKAEEAKQNILSGLGIKNKNEEKISFFKKIKKFFGI